MSLVIHNRIDYPVDSVADWGKYSVKGAHNFRKQLEASDCIIGDQYPIPARSTDIVHWREHDAFSGNTLFFQNKAIYSGVYPSFDTDTYKGKQYHIYSENGNKLDYYTNINGIGSDYDLSTVGNMPLYKQYNSGKYLSYSPGASVHNLRNCFIHSLYFETHKDSYNNNYVDFKIDYTDADTGERRNITLDTEKINNPDSGYLSYYGVDEYYEIDWNSPDSLVGVTGKNVSWFLQKGWTSEIKGVVRLSFREVYFNNTNGKIRSRYMQYFRQIYVPIINPENEYPIHLNTALLHGHEYTRDNGSWNDLTINNIDKWQRVISNRKNLIH